MTEGERNRLESVESCVKGRHFQIYSRAHNWSYEKIRAASGTIEEFLTTKGLPQDRLTFVAVGSLGRREALEASDLDLVPACQDDDTLSNFRQFDKELRSLLAERLQIKVSAGEDLTQATCLETLVDPESIGGKADSSGSLTKRVLLLTESTQLGGHLDVADVRRRILDAYAKEARTSGRHVLSLCNDIARYYKTLCIEYKAKIDEEDKDWCSRNIKLRHSRKFWYFANIVSISILADRYPQGDSSFVDALLADFELPPAERIARSLCHRHPLSVGAILENYALYLDFMSRTENRQALSQVQHEDRYRMDRANPFPTMKFNSDALHMGMMSLLEQLGPEIRSRIISWFLL